MAFALWAKQIKCPNCKYEGKASVQGSGCGLWLLFLALFLISCFFWPLFIVAGAVTQLADGRWVCYYRVSGPDGRRILK